MAERVLTLKRFPTFVLAGLLLASTANPAGAVGLGVLEVESGPGDPLRARIPLIDLGGVRPTELDIAIASVADYRQANATRYEILSSISLHVETGSDGAWVVLTTEQPIPESSSTIILDTTWPGGRILSQHLLRIDAPPPSYIAPAAPSEETSTGGELSGAGRQTIRPVSGDSLWRIAERLAGPNPENLNRTMLALHRLNPEAFIGGDIDRLRADVELRVPDMDEVSAPGQSAARDEIAWQPAGGDARRLQPIAAPAPAADRDGGQPAVQLSLLVQDSGDDGRAGGDELDRRIAELENQLALTEEEADRVRVEQEELRARLDDLDEQIAVARQIIELQEQELAQLQASLAARAEERARREAGRSAEADAEAAAGDEARAAADFPESLLENPAYLVIGAAILVLALALAIVPMSRGNRRDDDEREETFAVIGGEDTSGRGETGEDSDGGYGEESMEEKAPPELGEDTADAPLAKNQLYGEGRPESGAEFAIEAEAEAETEESSWTDAIETDETDADRDKEEVIAEQLNLAYSVYRMGDTEKARGILENVIRTGNDWHVSEARQLLAIIAESG